MSEKKCYTVQQKHTIWLSADVEADSEEEAIKIAEAGGVDWEFIDDTLCEDGSIEISP